MVVSPHASATRAGAEILARGGNAFDAAIAVSACLGVVYPHMTGVGGDSFWLMYNAADRGISAYNGSGRSGGQISRSLYNDLKSIPTRGPKSAITVPGMVDAWDQVLNAYGRLSLAAVLEPAIRYAREGFPMSRSQYDYTAMNSALLQEDPHTAAIYCPQGCALKPGTKFVQQELAATLSVLAKEGRDSFYRGSLAKRIIRDLQSKGGWLTLDDFADHSGNWVDPISTTYRGSTMLQLPPNSQGFTGLMALNILENYDLAAFGHDSYEYYHLLVESLKLSFRDRNHYLTDPYFSPVPLERLLSKEYAGQLSQDIQIDKAADVQSPALGSDTAYAAVVDKEGNTVSFIQSLYFEFGSGVTLGDTGVLLQNRGSFFSLDPAHVNRLEPGKRTFHTLMPAMALREGKPYILYGTQGGEGQPQTQTAVITRMIDCGLEPFEAVAAPRFVWGRTWGEESRELKLEARIRQETVRRLAAAGHLTRTVSSYDRVMGQAGAIQILPNGRLLGGIDPRSDGAAFGG